MRRSLPRPLFLLLGLAIALGAGWLPSPTRVIALAGDKPPNLQMIRLRDWHVERSSGRRLLRFTTIFVNQGPGPFELRGHRDSTRDSTMDINQIMYRWGGDKRRIATKGIARYSGDGHDHWHVQDVVTYEAWKLNDPASTARRGAKTGFCFFDTTAWKLSLSHARQSPYYKQEWCGTKSVLANRVGVSVGWGDRYPWNFAYQWIDISGLPGGVYKVRATVDIQDYYSETDDLDNCVWTEVRIPAPGSGNALDALRSGRGCGKSAITAVQEFRDGDSFEPPRTATIDAGVHIGWTFNSHGTRLRKLWGNSGQQRTATTTARAVPPGDAGSWLYIASGHYSGYWLEQRGGVHLEP
jgi:hypothetical protein